MENEENSYDAVMKIVIIVCFSCFGNLYDPLKIAYHPTPHRRVSSKRRNWIWTLLKCNDFLSTKWVNKLKINLLNRFMQLTKVLGKNVKAGREW